MKATPSLKYLLTILTTALIVAPAAAFGGSSDFDDVASDSTFYDEIEWMRQTGITQGCGDNLYCPEDPVSRQQMAAFMFRLAESQTVDAGTVQGLDIQNFVPGRAYSSVVAGTVSIVADGDRIIHSLVADGENCSSGEPAPRTMFVSVTAHTNNMNDGESASFVIGVNGNLQTNSRQIQYSTNAIIHVQATVQVSGAAPVIQVWVEEDDGDIFDVSNIDLFAHTVAKNCGV